MQITMFDRAPLEKVRRLADGRIAAVAKFARSGVYQYAGSEVGRPELATVNVYRPSDEVFDQAAMASFAHKAITVGHPSNAVTADNWKQHSAGWTEGKVVRDGEHVEIPLMLADASAVQAYDSGVNQLSAGYVCELDWGDGIAPDGTRYQATQRQIRGNHIALVPQGRAGETCRIGDSSMTDDAQLRAEVERQRMAHDQRFAFMGDAAPKFDQALAELIVRSSLNAYAGKAVRDAAMASRHLGADPSTEYARMVSDTRDAGRSAPADLAQVRDMARAARYGS